MTSLLPKQRIGSAYSVITIVETLGSMLGSPCLATLFKDEIRLGGGWIGLPFHFIGVVYGLATLLLLFVGLRKGEADEVGSEQEEEDT